MVSDVIFILASVVSLTLECKPFCMLAKGALHTMTKVVTEGIQPIFMHKVIKAKKMFEKQISNHCI